MTRNRFGPIALSIVGEILTVFGLTSRPVAQPDAHLYLCSYAVRRELVSMWSTVNFGRFRAKALTLPQIILKDPDWFFWAVDEGVFKGALAAEAKTLARRAKAIKLPPHLAATDCVQYWLTPDGKFAGFAVIAQSQPPHVGSSSEIRSPTLNLAAPRSFKGYDKLGCRLMIKTFRYHWFGGKSFTKTRAEAFFDEPAHFITP